MIKEFERKLFSGWLVLAVLVATLIGAVLLLVFGPLLVKIISAVWVLFDIFFMVGFFFINPNEARVLQFFGKYVGTTRQIEFLLRKELIRAGRLKVPKKYSE